jgi:hypothetical protein
MPKTYTHLPFSEQNATERRVRKYLREQLGRADAADRMERDAEGLPVSPEAAQLQSLVASSSSVAECAERIVRRVGPPPGAKAKLAKEIKMMLHASRDCLRTRFMADTSRPDPRKVRFVASDGYYGEAFGIIRAIEVLGWGEYSAVNVEGNLHHWFQQLQNEVLAEENFRGSGRCERCLKVFHKDDLLMTERLQPDSDGAKVELKDLDITQQEHDLMKQGYIINAIKAVRGRKKDEAGLPYPLKESKDLVEAAANKLGLRDPIRGTWLVQLRS